MAAWIVGGSGVLLSLWVGCYHFAFSVPEILFWIGVSNLAAFAGVLLTLQLEKVAWIKAYFLAGTARTWGFLTLVYFGVLLAPAPELREWPVLSWMFFPLLMSTGLMIPPFLGPAQDWIVRNAQRRERLKTRLAAERP